MAWITQTRDGITMYSLRASAVRAARRGKARGERDGDQRDADQLTGIVAEVCESQHVHDLSHPVTFTHEDQSIRDLHAALVKIRDADTHTHTRKG